MVLKKGRHKGFTPCFKWLKRRTIPKISVNFCGSARLVLPSMGPTQPAKTHHRTTSGRGAKIRAGCRELLSSGTSSGHPPDGVEFKADEVAGSVPITDVARIETQVEIASKNDIVTARQKGRALARELGFSGSETTLITAAISEVARNIVEHARRGKICLTGIQESWRNGIEIIARDGGPGIPDVSQAMQYGFSTRKRPGVGLPGAKWLMDEFEIESRPGRGTVVTMKKWTTNTSDD